MQLAVGKRDDSLEALRGIAALVVVGSHASLAFSPQISGIFPGFPPDASWNGSLLFLFINGGGAVSLFFVLSALVLTQKALAQQDAEVIWRNVIKRYPRLMLPVLISTVSSCALFMLGWYHFEAAATITGSPWLMKFAYAYDTPFVPSWWDAIRQGLFDSFLLTGSVYNSSLWTMNYEFIASFIVLAAAWLVIKLRQYELSRVAIFIPLILCGALIFDKWYFAFALGFLLACVLTSVWGDRLQHIGVLRYGVIILGLYLLGTSQPRGYYFWIGSIDSVYFNSLGACLLIVGVRACKPLTGAGSTVAKWLGDLSFPIYLMHIPVLCSYVCWMFVQLAAYDGLWLRLSMVLLLFIASVAVSIPFMEMNKIWLRALNAAVNRLLVR